MAKQSDYDSTTDKFVKNLVENLVYDPGKDDNVRIDKLKEKELLDLLARLALKAKSTRSRHWLRHGYLIDLGKVLRRLYGINVHRWGLDKGLSREELKRFETYFRGKV